MPHSGQAMAGKRVSPESRADDLHAAFSDPDVAVVLAAIGGDHAVELLPHLDDQLIRAKHCSHRNEFRVERRANGDASSVMAMRDQWDEWRWPMTRYGLMLAVSGTVG
jgi:LD-carboxypeptidase N-terminal domain